jgi:hypothetical protein
VIIFTRLPVMPRVASFVSACCVGCLSLLGMVGNDLFAQKAGATDHYRIRDDSFILPQSLPGGKYTHSIGINYVIVPKDWSLDNIQAPMFNYSGKYSLPKGFNIQANISTLILSNRIVVGPFWNHAFGNHLYVGIGYQVAFNAGVLKEFGYNTVLTGWEQQPSVTVGYSFNKSVLTVRGEIYYTNAFYLEEGGNVIGFTNGGLNGVGVISTLEQRLWKNRLMSFGVKLAVVRYHILAWPTFPVNKYRYLVPEFQLGLKLGKNK